VAGKGTCCWQKSRPRYSADNQLDRLHDAQRDVLAGSAIAAAARPAALLTSAPHHQPRHHIQAGAAAEQLPSVARPRILQTFSGAIKRLPQLNLSAPAGGVATLSARSTTSMPLRITKIADGHGFAIRNLRSGSIAGERARCNDFPKGSNHRREQDQQTDCRPERKVDMNQKTS